jgi:hypothetical protein
LLCTDKKKERWWRVGLEKCTIWMQLHDRSAIFILNLSRKSVCGSVYPNWRLFSLLLKILYFLCWTLFTLTLSLKMLDCVSLCLCRLNKKFVAWVHHAVGIALKNDTFHKHFLKYSHGWKYLLNEYLGISRISIFCPAQGFV